MQNVLRQLLVLQDRDKKLQVLEAEMRRIPKAVESETKRLQYEQDFLRKLETEHKQTEVAANQTRLERRVRQETVEKLNTQIYETSKNEEIVALKAEVLRYQTIVSNYETKELELLEVVDQQRDAAARQRDVLEERKKTRSENVTDLKQKAKVFVEKFKEAKAERVGAAEGIDQEALSLYERLFKSKGDQAVVELEGGICQGCNMKVVPNTLAKLRSGKELTQCENCGRILVEV